MERFAGVDAKLALRLNAVGGEFGVRRLFAYAELTLKH
jgi:hypothetical protein